ncbi:MULTISPECIES: ABC transporter substrate-binding protein [Limnochorda]|uniref:ABC transporter substrate-binding protein n=1 Tax=Limnochorda TaxID=1676651 RepID=UPI001D4446D2|nr:ABC transporter substrate-binding protein [Limnochorda pilosa]MBO2487384.1 iron ABC transporter substrate-binding protein [Bacillota bacterium]MBO2520150.1 iron ABC transporter substrate-binding protein [Bacillota bacterium]
MKRAVVLLAILGLLTLPAAAQQKVTVYTTLFEPTARLVFAEFEKDTGIRVEWVRLSSGEAVARLDAERNNPQASIWFGGVGLNHIEAKQKGLTEPYVSPNIENIPAQFRDPDHYWTGIYVGPLTFISNTERLKELGIDPPTSWADLLNPKLKGEIQMANPGTSGTAYNVVATLVQLWGEDEAFEYLAKLHQNIQQYTRSGNAPNTAVAIGEVAVGIGYAHDQLTVLTQGYPVVITAPEEGTGYEIASISLVKGGPEPEAARKLYDWALTERAAKLYASTNVVPIIDVPLVEGAISLSEVNVIDQDDVWAAAERERLVDRWMNEIYRSR